MDAYFPRRARRPTASMASSLKRLSPVTAPMQATVTTTATATTTTTTTTATPSKNIKNTDITNKTNLSEETSTSLSPAKTPSPQPSLSRPVTPSNSRLERPVKPPPVKRKLIPNDLKRERRPKTTTIRELFKSVHPLEDSEDEDNNNNNNNDKQTPQLLPSDHNDQTSSPNDIASTFGLKRLNLPATPPATPVKQKVKRLPQPVENQPESPSKIASGPLRGVSTSLLDLIRAKEAKAKQVSPELERQRELLGIAPEIVRIVPTVFTANKKEVMLYDKVVEKCYKGLKSNYESRTIIECLDLMGKVAPEWVSIVEISRGRFMRLNKKNYTLPQLLASIQRFKREKGIS